MPSLAKSSSLPFIPAPVEPYAGTMDTQGPAGRRYREAQKIMRSMPSPRWVLDVEDFFLQHRQKPNWHNGVELFKNEGTPQQYRSYFDRWRDKASDILPNVGRMRSRLVKDSRLFLQNIQHIHQSS